MKALAKAGFSQSYTYFTWRNNRRELTEYLTELTQSEMKEYLPGQPLARTPLIFCTSLCSWAGCQLSSCGWCWLPPFLRPTGFTAATNWVSIPL